MTTHTPGRSRPIDKDKLYMMPREDAVTYGFHALHAIQDETPERQVAGAAVLFFTICNRVGLDPEDLYLFGGKVLRDQEGSLKTNGIVQSMRDYAGLRIAGQDVVVS